MDGSRTARISGEASGAPKTIVVSRPPGSKDEAGDRHSVIADLVDGHPTIVLEHVPRA